MRTLREVCLRLLRVIACSNAVLTSYAQQFTWGLEGPSPFQQNDTNSLSQCARGIQAVSYTRADFVTPPFSVLAFSPGQQAQTYQLGSATRANLSIDFAAGSLVAFTLIDSAGHSAGTTYFYNIQDTSDSSCLPAIKPEPTVRIQVNTTSLDACDFIGVGFSGGVPPYSCLVTPVNSYRFLDVPLGNGNAGFSWLNTLPASTQILVTGVDSRGQLSATSPVVSSTSTNSSVCIGSSSALLGPVSGKDTFDSNADPRNNGNGGMGAGIIAGTVVGTIAAIAVLAGLAYLYYRRRRRLRRSPVTPAGDISPFANDDEDYESARPVFGAGSSGNDAAPAGALAGPTSAIVAPTTYPEMRETGAAASLAAASTNRPASGAETDSLLAANTSTAASQATAAPPSPRRRPLPAPPRIITGRVPAPSNLTDAHSAMAGKTTGTADDASRSSAVLQHQDAGPAGPSRGQERVEEVPPPYIDRHGEIQ